MKVSAFTINRVIGIILLAALVYGTLKTFGFLPEWAPALLPKGSGPPAP